jgi:hypothetical protein
MDLALVGGAVAASLSLGAGIWKSIHGRRAGSSLNDTREARVVEILEELKSSLENGPKSTSIGTSPKPQVEAIVEQLTAPERAEIARALIKQGQH